MEEVEVAECRGAGDVDPSAHGERADRRRVAGEYDGEEVGVRFLCACEVHRLYRVEGTVHCSLKSRVVWGGEPLVVELRVRRGEEVKVRVRRRRPEGRRREGGGGGGGKKWGGGGKKWGAESRWRGRCATERTRCVDASVEVDAGNAVGVKGVGTRPRRRRRRRRRVEGLEAYGAVGGRRRGTGRRSHDRRNHKRSLCWTDAKSEKKSVLNVYYVCTYFLKHLLTLNFVSFTFFCF